MKSNGAQYAALVSRHVRKNVNGNFKQHQKMNKRTGSPAINHNKILSFFQALCQAMLNTQNKNIANLEKTHKKSIFKWFNHQGMGNPPTHP